VTLGADRRRLARALTRAGAVALGIATLASCGSTHANRPALSSDPPAVPSTAAPRTASTSAGPTPSATPPTGRRVLLFKRSIGVDPEASYFTLYTSGQGIATVVYGGRDGARVHKFALGPDELRRIERLLERTRLQNAPVQNPGLYTYWVITDSGAHRLQQGAVPRSAQTLVRTLNAIADANHLY
jgi:hypothetical protein